jgi:hypothetical protein
VYTRNVKKCGPYLPFRKEFTIEMDNHTYQRKQGTNVCDFCVIDYVSLPQQEYGWGAEKRGNILMHIWFILHFNS